MKRNVSKRVLGMLMAVLLVAGLATPVVNTKAYYYSQSMSQIVQTDATDNSATIAWTPVTGAAGYKIYIGNAEYPIATVDANTTSYVVGGLLPDSRATIWIYPYGVDPATGATDDGYCGYVIVKTTTKLTGVDYYSYGFASKGSGLEIKWNYSTYADGFQAVLYNKKGKKVQTVESASAYTSHCKFTKANRKNIYYVQVRSYITLANGYKKYGAFSDKFYAVPQPVMTSSNSDVHKNSVSLKWKKVTGASSYTIYASTSASKTGSKVATVKKNSYNFKKLKGKTINTTKKTYYITVVTNTKVGKKTKKSEKLFYTRVYSYYY